MGGENFSWGAELNPANGRVELVRTPFRQLVALCIAKIRAVPLPRDGLARDNPKSSTDLCIH